MKRPRPIDREGGQGRPTPPRARGAGVPGVAPGSRRDPALWVVAAVAIAYYAAFIWRTSFVLDDTRYFTLFDDAMVSMRYARNLARGHGLVWNVGEPPVEGFSNPLWTLMMSAVHLLRLPSPSMALVIQGLGAAILVALLVTIRRVCGAATGVGITPGPTVGGGSSSGVTHLGAPRALALTATILVAFYYPLIYWTLEGMEVGLLALCTAIACARLLAGRGIAGAYAVLGAGVLVRLDFALVAATLAVAFARLDRNRAARHLVAGAAAVLVALGVQTVARSVYFHDLLPNTYYLKLTGYPLGLRLRHGVSVLFETLALGKGLLVLLPLAGLYLARGAARVRLAVLMVPFLVLCGYSVWVGGDAWEGTIPCNRFVSVGVPLALVAAAWPVAWLASRLAGGRRAESGVAVALALVVVFAVTPYRATAMLDPPAYRRENADLAARGLAAAGLVREGGSIAAAAVGAIGYHCDVMVVDLLGKSDRHIARLPMRRPSDPTSSFMPGHLKWDYAYSIGELRPDVVAQLWWSPGEADPYLQRDYTPVMAVVGGRSFNMAARRGSPYVGWQESSDPDSTPAEHPGGDDGRR